NKCSSANECLHESLSKRTLIIRQQACYTKVAKKTERRIIVGDAIPIGPTLSRIGQIFVNVKDLDRAIAFYRDTLGMQFLFQAPPAMAFFDCSGVRLMLGVPERPDLDHPASLIYYRVDDIEKVYRTLHERGVVLD